MLRADRNKLIKKGKKIRENWWRVSKGMGSRAQEEWLDLNRNTVSHRKEGRMCGYRYSLVDRCGRNLEKFSSCCSIFWVKWEVGHQLRVRMVKEGWRFEERRRWCEIIQKNEKMDQGNMVWLLGIIKGHLRFVVMVLKSNQRVLFCCFLFRLHL